VADIVDAAAAVAPVQALRVDGGLTAEPELLRIQADATGLPLETRGPDQTVLGAALLAGVGAGVFASPEEAASALPSGRIVQPRVGEAERERGRESWRAFVAASAALDGV
jgi:glycerol kinase